MQKSNNFLKCKEYLQLDTRHKITKTRRLIKIYLWCIFMLKLGRYQSSAGESRNQDKSFGKHWSGQILPSLWGYNGPINPLKTKKEATRIAYLVKAWWYEFKFQTLKLRSLAWLCPPRTPALTDKQILRAPWPATLVRRCVSSSLGDRISRQLDWDRGRYPTAGSGLPKSRSHHTLLTQKKTTYPENQTKQIRLLSVRTICTGKVASVCIPFEPT